jgi:ABC-2 type transport system ATP-binding protein
VSVLAGGDPAHPLVHLLPTLAPALVPVLALLLGLDVYCLVNLARAKSVRNAPKLAWAIVILFVSAPLGAILYLFFGMDRTSHGGRAEPPAASGTASAGTARGGTAGPAPATTMTRLPEGRPAIITATGLTRDYGGAGLFDVDLAVPRGCIYGLVGLNGAGKTTLLSILAGTRHADRGRVSLAIERRKVAVCPDVPEFDPWLTAREAVDLARSLAAPAAGPAPGPAAAEATLRTVGLADAADRRVGGLSRGMVQRLGLACALVGEPELLILDEPMSALDPAGRAEMLSLIAAMRGTRTVIFSSHILADVQRIADQVAILRSGRLLYQGGTRELMDDYLTPSWLVRIAGGTGTVAAALAAQSWVISVEPTEPGVLRVDATAIEDGERGIPAVIAACGARQVSCEPAAADLESAFLALTQSGAATAMTGTARP